MRPILKVFSIIVLVLFSISFFRVLLGREPLTLSAFLNQIKSLEFEFPLSLQSLALIKDTANSFNLMSYNVNGVWDIFKLIVSSFTLTFRLLYLLGQCLTLVLCFIADIGCIVIDLISFIFGIVGGSWTGMPDL